MGTDNVLILFYMITKLRLEIGYGHMIMPHEKRVSNLKSKMVF